MAETLRRLVNLGSFSVLQEKLERWQDNYHLNTDSLNASTCCEVMELNAQVHDQLIKVLDIVSPGTSYSTLRSRYPYYPYGYWRNGYLYPDLYWSELSAKNRELRSVKDVYEQSLQTVENDLQATRDEADDLQAELDETRAELEDEKRQSTSVKMFSEAEMREMKSKLSRANEDIATLRSKLNVSETKNSRLRGELLVNGYRSVELDLPPLRSSLKRSVSPLPRPTSPLVYDDVTQRVRQTALMSRFNDMFAQDRLEAMDTLRKFSDDYENNQRIVFTAMQEAFTSAKLAFAGYRTRVRSNLVATHVGPETLDEAVQDYINRNTDLYDLPGLVNDVIRALNRNTRLLLPGEVTFTIIKPFVREACKLAWEMTALANPLDVAVASDNELFDDNKYRRSYDSEYSAALVGHHIWPCLVQGLKVIMKGEACTRRASTAMRRSRSPVRASSPLRASRARSSSPLRRNRSPSPRRLDTSLKDGTKSGAPSRASSRAFTASTRLSHYGVSS